MIVALDFVIIPPMQIVEEAISINRALDDQRLILGTSHTIPHVSLCMVLARKEDVDEITAKLQDLTAKVDMPHFTIDSIYQYGSQTVGWNIEKTSWLDKLHYKAMDVLREYHHRVPSSDTSCFSWVNPLNPYSGIEYLNHYFEDFGGNKFLPHITLGKGDPNLVAGKEGYKFSGGHLALYHLGSGCTCQKLLKKF